MISTKLKMQEVIFYYHFTAYCIINDLSSYLSYLVFRLEVIFCQFKIYYFSVKYQIVRFAENLCSKTIR